MDSDARIKCLRAWVADLALAIANEPDQWDLQTVAGHLHMGEKGLNYMFPDPVPEKLTGDQVQAAIDRIFEKAEI